MRTLTENELNEVLRKHILWIRGMEGGKRADLSGANLSEANLSDADLCRANLSDVNLSDVNLRRARLYGANLSEANLCRTNLSGANLSDADLSRANLSEADLSEANLCRANLSEADLSEADLRRANLSDVNLSDVNLRRANLSDADLRRAMNIPYIPLACPEEGAFIGFKKAYNDQIDHQPVIVKLLILEDAKRYSSTSNKCRCSKAKVLDIQDILGNSVDIIAYSKFDTSFTYKIGEIVEVSDFNEDRFVECGAGIHFFINRQDAVNY